MQVLIVDPAAIVGQRLVALLTGVGQVAVIGQAERATQAIVALCVLRPGLVILDIQMPDGDGVAVLVPTNGAVAYHRLRCEAAGADFFLDQSKQFEDIPRIVRGMIEQGVANYD